MASDVESGNPEALSSMGTYETRILNEATLTSRTFSTFSIFRGGVAFNDYGPLEQHY